MVIDLGERIGPYVGVAMRAHLHFEEVHRNFTIALYGAYDAYGLIGPEVNGIVVLDDDNMQVVADEIERTNSGYFGPSKAQEERFGEIARMDWPSFRAFVNAQGRLRYRI